MNRKRAECLCLASAADDAYAMPLAVTLKSACAHLNAKQPVLIYVLDGGIRKSNRLKIERSLGARTRIVWLKTDLSRIRKLSVSGHLTPSTYLKILLPSQMPEHLGKMIYLDADVVVLENLEKLWRIALGKNDVLAVRDAYVCRPGGPRQGGPGARAKYFNAGLMVLDLGAWRRKNLTQKMLRYAAGKGRAIKLMDQDVLNAFLGKRWKEIDPRWNQQSFFYQYARLKKPPFPRKICSSLIAKPYMIHFSHGAKPWLNPWDHHPGKKYFFQYLDQTAWAGWRPSLKEILWKRIAAKRRRDHARLSA